MNKQPTLDAIQNLGLLAVPRGPSEELTIKMVEALIAGGVLGIEITYTTPGAAAVVRDLGQRHGDRIILGMGTLTEPEQAREAQAAGARFLVSPHTDPELAAAMAATELPFMMGGFTPTEIRLAHKLGSDVVKLFPGSLGGPDYMKALKGPFPGIAMMPTGGVTKDNLGAWFAAGAFAVGAGSDLSPVVWAKEGRFDDITRRAQEFVAAIQIARQH
jgi:2-dehydro-3-deoxyphosphogluconate aldolase/(4S)-4-hydroxy-2-oxoglutarate aldolase